MATKIFIEDTLTGERTDASTPEGKALLLKDLEKARNYSTEANMGDYSMASINHAKAQVDAAKQALTDAGYEIPAW